MDFILDLVFPKKCVICGRWGNFLCDGCRSELVLCKKGACPKCNRLSARGKFCPACQSKTALTGLVFPLYYKDVNAKQIMYEYKYNGIKGLSEILSDMIGKRIREEDLKINLISFVPTTRRRKAWRGFNQAEEIAKYLSGQSGIPCRELLLKKKDTKTQVGLTKKERERNLNNIFVPIPGPSIKGKSVLLIDDVYTTGTTLNECAKVLRNQGARQVWGATVAKE